MRASVLLVLAGCTSFPPETVHHQYVASRIAAADHRSLVDALALDLDANGSPDNQLGRFLVEFGSQAEVDPATAAAIGGDQILLLVDYVSDGDSARLRTLAGASPRPLCDDVIGPCIDPVREFSVVAGDQALVGTGDATSFDGDAGTITLPLATTAGIVQLPLASARVHATGISPTAIATALLGGAVSAGDVDRIVIPAIGDVVRTSVAADCTACDCTAGSHGADDLGLLDADHDCAITDAELRASSILQSALAPDVTIDGAPALSLGVELQAIEAKF